MKIKFLDLIFEKYAGVPWDWIII